MEFALKVQRTLELLQTSSVTLSQPRTVSRPANLQFPRTSISHYPMHLLNSLMNYSPTFPFPLRTSPLPTPPSSKSHHYCRTTTVAPSYFWDALFVGQQPRR